MEFDHLPTMRNSTRQLEKIPNYRSLNSPRKVLWYNQMSKSNVLRLLGNPLDFKNTLVS